jgi:signal recognition particle subunit SRP54
MVKEICNALMESDVNIKLVSGLRKSIKGSVNFKDIAPGVNKKRLIQKVDEAAPFNRPNANAVRLSSMSW